MKPSIQTLGQILYSPSQYVIPVFQRNYRWETKEWTKLWTSLSEIQQPEKSGNHFMGFLVFVSGLAQPGQHTTFYLIDGQQRLTSLSILLAAIRNVARACGQPDLAAEIHDYYLVHPLKKGEQHYRVLPKERDHDSYLAIVSGNGEPGGRMADALAHFEEQLSKVDASGLRTLFETINQRLEFMCATLESENAYNIFKSLNSTGVPLGASDLIRNFVFMHIPPDDQDGFDRDLWGPLEDSFAAGDGKLDEERFSRFFRDFLMTEGRYVPPKDTFAVFESRYEATAFSPRALAQALNEASRHYETICGATVDHDSTVTSALAGLNVFDTPTTYPLLLALFKLRDQGAIDSAALSRSTEMLRGFILRRFICGESSRGYGQMFVRALSEASDDPVGTLERFLLDRGWPDDRRFQAAFVEFPLYKRGYFREVLVALERARGHKEPADLGNAEVEHVMPQTLSTRWHQELGEEADRIHTDWLHRPGNLTLSAYNQELWNHDFDTKRARYAQSNVVLTRELVDYPRWGEVEIRERGHRLAREATSIWIGPKEPPAAAVIAAADEDEGQTRQELRRQFWEGLIDHLAAEHPEIPGFDPRPSWTIRLSSGIRHIGVELRFGLRNSHVGIDVWFWREASLPIWEKIRSSPEGYNALVGDEWAFDKLEGRDRGRMFVEQTINGLRSPSSWPEAYQWLGQRLAAILMRVVPALRAEIDNSSVAS